LRTFPTRRSSDLLESNAVRVAESEAGPRLAIANKDALNPQGKALGFENGDELLKINGELIPYNQEFPAFIQKQQQSLVEGKPLLYTVVRKDQAGASKEVELSANAFTVEREIRHLIGWNDQATPEQIALQKAWIGNE